jgi:cell division protein FtsB
MSKWLYHPLAVIVFTIVITWLYASLLRTENQMRISTESVTVLDQEVNKIASEVSNLENTLLYAKSDSAQEQKIRDELLMKKPGEYVIQLPITTKTEQPTINSSKPSAWQEWQKLLQFSTF